MKRLAVSGASGKTGWRIVDEALQRGIPVRAIIRPTSHLPPDLLQAEQAGNLEVHRLDLNSLESLLHALQGCTGLVIATGARPSINLAGPLQVDAVGVQSQVQACCSLGVRRVVLVSSLCAGRWFHPLNLFGLILVWKRVGERWLEQSGLDWTIVRPGGLSEDDSRASGDGVLFSSADQQQSQSIPRRLVAHVCIDALEEPSACGQIIEITSSVEQPQQSLADWLAQAR